MAEKKQKSGLLLEGVVIVASILLAFAIDAWWDGFRESRETRTLLESIRSDVVATQAVIAENRSDSELVAERARALLGAMAAADTSADAMRERLLTLGNIFVIGGWSPINDTYAEAVNSGRLQLIDDDALRIALFRYEAQIEELDQMYLEISEQYYARLEPFLVANTVYSELGAEWWREALVEAPDTPNFRMDFEALGKSRELWNLLTLRLEMEVTVLDRLRRMDARTDEVLELLPPAD